MTATTSGVDSERCYLPSRMNWRGQGRVLRLEPGALLLRANTFAA